jgi:hypothetical protein
LSRSWKLPSALTRSGRLILLSRWLPDEYFLDEPFAAEDEGNGRRSAIESSPRTSPGNLGGAETAQRARAEQGWTGRGPSVVVTDLGVYRFDEAGAMFPASLHPGVTSEQAHEATGWDLTLPADLETTAPPDYRRAPTHP